MNPTRPNDQTPDNVEEICRRLETLKEPVPTDDERPLIEQMQRLNKPATLEQIAAIRERLLEPWYRTWFRRGLWAVGIYFIFVLFTQFSVRPDKEYNYFQQRAEERDRILSAYATGDRVELFRVLNESIRKILQTWPANNPFTI